jgi:hypothetical protein
VSPWVSWTAANFARFAALRETMPLATVAVALLFFAAWRELLSAGLDRRDAYPTIRAFVAGIFTTFHVA